MVINKSTDWINKKYYLAKYNILINHKQIDFNSYVVFPEIYGRLDYINNNQKPFIKRIIKFIELWFNILLLTIRSKISDLTIKKNGVIIDEILSDYIPTMDIVSDNYSKEILHGKYGVMYVNKLTIESFKNIVGIIKKYAIDNKILIVVNSGTLPTVEDVLNSLHIQLSVHNVFNINGYSVFKVSYNNCTAYITDYTIGN